MSKVITKAARQVENTNAVLLEGATFNGVGPVSGMFEICDADLCSFGDEKGLTTVIVLCRLGDSEDEDQCLELQCHGPMIHIVEGFDGEVIDAIAIE